MRVINLRAKNIKNLTAVEITPSEDAIILRGKNGAGKSAVIDSIFMALTGAKIDRPIREGENKAVIDLDLGTCKVTRTYTPKGSYLKVTSKEGSSFASPQAMLDKLLGKLSFDPLHFISLRPAAQRIILMDLAGLNFDEIDTQRQKLYDERTLVNRQARDVQGQRRGPGLIPDLPVEEINIETLVTKLNDLTRQSEAWNQWNYETDKQATSLSALDEHYEQRIQEHKRDIIEIEEKLASRKTQLEILKTTQTTEITRKQNQYKELKNKVPIQPMVEEITKASTAIKEAQETNITIRVVKEQHQLEAKLAEIESDSEQLTKRIQSCDTEKQAQIVAANMPIEGLAVDDEQVLYHGLPISQLSTGEQIRVSTSIAMALNPDLRVLCVREGSLLDDEGMQAIQQQAKDQDYQLWIERVSEGGVGVLIEDGSIKA